MPLQTKTNNIMYTFNEKDYDKTIEITIENGDKIKAAELTYNDFGSLNNDDYNNFLVFPVGDWTKNKMSFKVFLYDGVYVDRTVYYRLIKKLDVSVNKVDNNTRDKNYNHIWVIDDKELRDFIDNTKCLQHYVHSSFVDFMRNNINRLCYRMGCSIDREILFFSSFIEHVIISKKNNEKSIKVFEYNNNVKVVPQSRAGIDIIGGEFVKEERDMAIVLNKSCLPKKYHHLFDEDEQFIAIHDDNTFVSFFCPRYEPFYRSVWGALLSHKNNKRVYLWNMNKDWNEKYLIQDDSFENICRKVFKIKSFVLKTPEEVLLLIMHDKDSIISLETLKNGAIVFNKDAFLNDIHCINIRNDWDFECGLPMWEIEEQLLDFDWKG